MFDYLTKKISVMDKEMLPYNTSYDCVIRQFRNLEKTGNEWQLTFGYLFRDLQFFEAPFSFFYVRVDYLRQISIYYDFTITIFDKDFIKYTNFSGKANSIPFFLNVLNFINNFIELHNSFERLNLELLKERLNVVGRVSLLEILKSIRFEIYESGATRVGKDNVFWNEVVFWSYNDLDYFKNLLKTFLTESFHEPNVIINDSIEEYHIAIENESASGRSFNRRLLVDKELETEINLRLALWFEKNFDANQYECDLFILK